MLDYIPMTSVVSDSTFMHPISLCSSPTVLPTIMPPTYEEESRTLTCVSTGSPATTVSWMRNGLSIDDSTGYTLTQTVTDRVSSTYSNVLRISEGAPGGVAGTYSCTVSNELGSDSDVLSAVGKGFLDLKIYISCSVFFRYHYLWSGESSDSRPVSHYQLLD